jgi:hypothetical protein
MQLSIIIILIAITTSFLCIGSAEANPACKLSDYCTTSGWCENFTSLTELNSLLLSSTAVCQDLFSIFSNFNGEVTVHFRANKYKGLLNDQLDMNRFFKNFIPASVSSVSLNLWGFTGIDLNLTLGSQLLNNIVRHNWSQTGYLFNGYQYIGSSVDLYMNGAPIVMSSDGGHTCDETELAGIVNNTRMNFSVFSWSAQQIVLRNVKQSRGPLCALAFKNTNITQMLVYTSPVIFFSTISNVDMNGTSIQILTMCHMTI